ENSNSYDVSEHVTALKAIASGEQPMTATPAPEVAVETNTPAATVELPISQTSLRVDELLVAECLGRGECVYLTNWNPENDPQARNPVELLKRLGDTGAVLATTLPDAPSTSHSESFQIVLATILTVDQFAT